MNKAVFRTAAGSYVTSFIAEKCHFLFVTTRCPSSVVNFSHFRLLLLHHWTEFNETWEEATSQHPLPSLCFSGRSKKQDGHPGLWLAETFSTSPLKRLNGIQRNLTGNKMVEDVEILFPVKFRWIPFSRFRGEVEMSQPIRGQGGHLVFPIGPKNVNLVEDIEILLPVKFHWIPFSGFREVENVSANQRPGRPSCFSDRSEKHKLGRGRWDLASCQVSLNSIQPFQRRSRKCLSQSEARAAILFFRSARKTQTW